MVVHHLLKHKELTRQTQKIPATVTYHGFKFRSAFSRPCLCLAS